MSQQTLRNLIEHHARVYDIVTSSRTWQDPARAAQICALIRENLRHYGHETNEFTVGGWAAILRGDRACAESEGRRGWTSVNPNEITNQRDARHSEFFSIRVPHRVRRPSNQNAYACLVSGNKMCGAPVKRSEQR